MLDKISFEVLKYLYAECGNGYKAIEVKDIASNFAANNNFDENAAKKTMKALEKGDYIEIKYNDDSMFCVQVLPFGRQHIESKQDEIEKIIFYRKTVIKLLGLCMLVAFLGSFLATLIYYIIF